MSSILQIINKDKVTLAYLNILESGTVKQVVNGEYILSFTALIEPLKTEFLYDKDNLILYNNDYFRVINIEEEHNSDNMLKVYVNCEHISYDLITPKKPTYTQADKSAIYVMNDLLAGTGFQFLGTDVTTTASIDVQQEMDIKSLLYMVATIWGGELKYFQNTIELKQQLGINRGTDFRFGKNVANLKRLIDFVENTVAYEVEIVQGAEFEELGQYFLGDTVRAVDEALNIEIDIRTIELETDIVTGLNSRVVLGQPIKDLSTGFNNVFQSLSIAKQMATDANNKISEVVDEHGNLIASKLTGALNTAITKVSNSTGKTTFDDRGLIVHDQPIEITSIKAMLLTADGLLIANAKNADGTWRWRTAVTADGINADVITAGILRAIQIEGVIITGSEITSDNANAQIKLLNGILSIKNKLSNQQFNINYKTGLPNGITQTELEYYNEYKATNPNKLPTNTISLNSIDSYMDLAFGNAPVSLGNNWVKMMMYGGTFDWAKAYPTEYATYLSDKTKYNPPPANAQGSKLIIDLQGNYWVVRDSWGEGQYYIPPWVVTSTELVVKNAQKVSFESYMFVINSEITRVLGNFSVNGTKNCVIDTEKYGELYFSAYETAEIYLGDIGESEVMDGICTIQLDEKLLACVNTDIPYQVFLTPYGDGRVWVEQRNATNFVVKGDNIKFAWEVKAKRKKYENIRFGQTN